MEMRTFGNIILEGKQFERIEQENEGLKVDMINFCKSSLHEILMFQ